MRKADMKNRWEKESQEFLEALTGGNPVKHISKKRTQAGIPEELSEKAQRLRIKQTTAGGRPRLDSPATDRSVVYNFRIKETELQELKKLSLENTKTMRELISEAVGDLISKYREKQP